MRQLFQNAPPFLAFQFSSTDGSVERTLEGIDSVKICFNLFTVPSSNTDDLFWGLGIFHEEKFSPDIPSIRALPR
jgi:hypothetical protein